VLSSRKFARTLRHGCRTERGYILLSMMLFVTLLVIAAAAIAPTVAFQAKRDREEEMIHRGVQYSRAVRRYFKKFGRYPTRLEELENTNNLRFLRKRYKDPITGQDFKVLHLGEVQLSFGAGIAGATPAGALNQAAGQGFAAIANAQRQFQAANKPPDQNAGEGDDAAKKDSDSGSPDKLAGITFGGGPIVGVVSASKDTTIREFNKKKHYNQWQFIYDPASDRGGLLNTPNQPPLQGTGAISGGVAGGGPGGVPGGIPGQQPQTPPQPPNQNPDQQ
jgi:type II secretory pathway pseudopilin PulG